MVSCSLLYLLPTDATSYPLQTTSVLEPSFRSLGLSSLLPCRATTPASQDYQYISYLRLHLGFRPTLQSPIDSSLDTGRVSLPLLMSFFKDVPQTHHLRPVPPKYHQT